MSTLAIPRSVAIGGIASFDNENCSVPLPEFATLFDSTAHESQANMDIGSTTTTAPVLRRFVSTTLSPKLSAPGTGNLTLPTWSFTVTGLLGGETRAFRCIAINSVGKSLPGPIACYTTAPSTPTKCLRPRKSETDQKLGPRLIWDPPVHDGGVPVHWYKAEELQKHRDGTVSARTLYNGPQCWCEIAKEDSVPRGTSIRYRVQAFNMLGASAFSDALAVKARMCAPGIPPPPMEAKAPAQTNVSVSFHLRIFPGTYTRLNPAFRLGIGRVDHLEHCSQQRKATQRKREKVKSGYWSECEG